MFCLFKTIVLTKGPNYNISSTTIQFFAVAGQKFLKGFGNSVFLFYLGPTVC